MGLRRLAQVTAVGLINSLVRLRRPAMRPRPEVPALADIVERADEPTDISDHLVTIFVEAMAARPRLIVELGVRGGESTFVLERVAALQDAQLISVDLEDCSGVTRGGRSIFVQANDVEFAERFEQWCRERSITPSIDVLFIDTSHEYEHTVREIDAWFPLLAPKATVLLHDTNLLPVYRRKDGSRGLAWDNRRGVIRAIEEHFETTYDESMPFEDYRQGWLIRHVPWCCGLTILRRVSHGGAVAPCGHA